MKKKLFIGLLVLAFALPTVAQDFTNTIKLRPKSTWWKMQNWYNDEAQRWAREVEDRLIGASGIGYGQGTIFYVDNNSGDDDNNGKSWDEAFLTITVALRAAHVDIATSPNYADRNTVLVRGDDFDEDLTDLAQKTDVIGVGSDDGNKGPRLLGNHVIDATAAGYNYNGCRFINMTFLNQTAADHFTIPTGHHCIEWIGCRFESSGSAIAPSAVDVTACNGTKIIGCDFISSTNRWASGAIDIGAGLAQETYILGNYIDADIGITIDAGTTGDGCRIEGNTITATTLTVDDNADIFHVVENILITDGTKEQAFDFNQKLAANNYVTHAGGSVIIPYTRSNAWYIEAARRGGKGKVFFVDGNMSADTGDGLSWETAYNTLATALAASDADISVARNWANRNTIFVQGDALEEDLVLLAQKTDVIGVGVNNPYNKCGLKGNHIIPDTESAPSCRFYNFQFWGDQAGILWDIDTQAGMEFHDCIFQANAAATIGVEINNCPHFKLIDNWFGSPDGQDFTSSAIAVPQDATGAINILIKGNRIHSNGIGINWDETTNVDCWIEDNVFFTAGMGIDSEDVTEVMVVGNRMKVAVAAADNTSNDFNILWGIDNIVTGSDVTIYIPSPDDF